MATVYVENLSPVGGGDASVTKIEVPGNLSPLRQVAEVHLALAGDADNPGQTSGPGGTIDQLPTRVASDDDNVAQLVAAAYCVPEGTTLDDGTAVPPNDCAVVPADELAAEYHAINEGASQ